MSNGKQSKPEDTKTGKIIDAEVEPVSPEDAAKPGRPDDPPRVDLRSDGTAAGKSDPGKSDPGKGDPGKTDAGKSGPEKTATAGTDAPKAGGSSAAAAGVRSDGPGGRPGSTGSTGAKGGSSPAGAARGAAGSSGGGSSAGVSSGGGGSSGGTPRGPAGGAASGGRRGLIWTMVAAIAVLAVLLVGLVASPVVAPWLPEALGVAGPGGGEVTAEVDRLQSRLADLEGQVAAAGKASAAAQGQAGQLADLRKTVDGLQKQLQAVGGVSGRMDQIQKQLSALPRTDTSDLESAVAKLRSEQDALAAQLKAAGGPDPEVQKQLKQIDADIASVSRLSDSIQRRMSGMDNRLNDLRSQDDALDRRLAGLDDRIAAAARPSQSVTDALSELQARSAALDKRVADLDAALEAEKAARVAAEDRSAGRNQRVALVLGLGQIEDRMQDSAGFAAEAAALPALLTGSLARDPRAQEAVAVLRRHGDAGVPDFDRLRDGFMAAADQALRQRAVADGEPDFWEQVVDGARGLVSIRPVGDVAGDTPGAVLARAEAALGARNLARAVAEVEKLTGGPAEAMAGWLKQARARLAVTAALADLNDAITRSLGAGGQGSATQAPSAPTPAAAPTAAPAAATAPAATPEPPGSPAPSAPAAGSNASTGNAQ